MRLTSCLGILVALVVQTGPVSADEQSLLLKLGGVERRITASELLARPDAAEVIVPDDVSYGQAKTYRVVPLLALLPGVPEPFDTLEARALDGFAVQIPLSLVRGAASGGSVAWLAVELPGQPWPDLPGKAFGPGPFYLVWEGPDRSGVTQEQWPYQSASLTAVESPAHRWPQLAVDASLPPDAAARRGQQHFAAACLSCHRLNGGGAAEIGSDLGQPMNAVDYMTPVGLRALVRDPKSVRTWPQQQMPGFSADGCPTRSWMPSSPTSSTWHNAGEPRRARSKDHLDVWGARDGKDDRR